MGSQEELPDFAVRLRAARERAGVTQEELARRLGMSTKGYRAYEAGRRPGEERLADIALALGVGVADLFIDNSLTALRREVSRLAARVRALEQHRTNDDPPAASAGVTSH
ncbi:MAG TPA: helix-turn-helix transcriptional regulator [Solirubrobacterales bacterium]